MSFELYHPPTSINRILCGGKSLLNGIRLSVFKARQSVKTSNCMSRRHHWTTNVKSTCCLIGSVTVRALLQGLSNLFRQMGPTLQSGWISPGALFLNLSRRGSVNYQDTNESISPPMFLMARPPCPFINLSRSPIFQNQIGQQGTGS